MGFNPRAREGATDAHLPRHRERVVSIHAPARARRDQRVVLFDVFEFQSTRPRGRDTARRYRPRRPERFNPRAREGAT